MSSRETEKEGEEERVGKQRRRERRRRMWKQNLVPISRKT